MNRFSKVITMHRMASSFSSRPESKPRRSHLRFHLISAISGYHGISGSCPASRDRSLDMTYIELVDKSAKRQCSRPGTAKAHVVNRKYAHEVVTVHTQALAIKSRLQRNAIGCFRLDSLDCPCHALAYDLMDLTISSRHTGSMYILMSIPRNHDTLCN